jgi:hypothetical protein
MMDEKDTQASERRPYEAPSVRVLGTLLELTEAGSQSQPNEVVFPNASQA